MLEKLIKEPTPYLFFTGKGGVGKTSLSAAVAVALADRGLRVLLVSTDPASNLSEVLGTLLDSKERPVVDVEGLWALDIDPQAAAAAYRERVVGPYRGVLPVTVLAGIEEQLSGACTVEIAAFDEFTGLLADTSGYDHIVFDTAPTGHTLRLLALPGAWTSYLDANTAGVTCIGPLSGLGGQRARYRDALAALSDPTRATLVLVARLDAGAVAEANRASSELAAAGLQNQRLAINGVFEAVGDDRVALRLAERQHAVLDTLPEQLAALPTDLIPLVANPPVGIAGLRALLQPDYRNSDTPRADSKSDVPADTLADLVDSIAAKGRGLVMTVGKGGVGKTTLAASIACSLAESGIPVVLSTTDPAAHLTGVLGAGDLPDGLVVERIDPEATTAAYTAEVLSTVGAGLDAAGRAVLEEDLRSPCTEEIAVFREFSATVAHAENRVVVLDTAPSGHTLLLLDAARSFQREVARHTTEVPAEVGNLLDRLADPDFTTILVVTLPEATPVHEASALQDDLRRAGIEPAAWVVNQSLAATGTGDPILAVLAKHESRWIAVAGSVSSGTLIVVNWAPEPLIGVKALLSLVARSQ